jgi:PhnB protein
MEFYKDCLGGELTIQVIGESPHSQNLPKRMKDCILHSILRKGALVLMGSDIVPEEGLIQGNSVCLALDCSSEAELRKIYKMLSAGGKTSNPITPTFWGNLYGTLTDRFGNHWVLNYAQQKTDLAPENGNT